MHFSDVRYQLVALFALLTICSGAVVAQDFDAVEQRLVEAVQDGELSLEQAARMMEALKDSADKNDRDKDAEEDNVEHEAWRQFEAWIDGVAHKLKSAVEEGDLDEETAHKKWRHFLEEAVGPKLKAAVAKGMLDEEEAWEVWKELQHGDGEDEYDERKRGDGEDTQAQFKAWIEKVGEGLKDAIAAGKLDEDTAWEKWQSFKENELAPKLKSAVKSGLVDDDFARDQWKKLAEAEEREKGDIDE